MQQLQNLQLGMKELNFRLLEIPVEIKIPETRLVGRKFHILPSPKVPCCRFNPMEVNFTFGRFDVESIDVDSNNCVTLV